MTFLQAKTYAREMRKAPTKAEDFFWQHVRNRKISNLKFRRQHPIKYHNKKGNELYFIVDFFCDSAKLVIEIDGRIHDNQVELDQERTDIIIADYDCTVLRFTNEEVLNEWYKIAVKLSEFNESD